MILFKKDYVFSFSINIIGHRVIEEINTFEYKEETSSDIVSFRNTENNEILDRNESKDSTDNSYSHIEFTSSQELCNYSSFNMVNN